VVWLNFLKIDFSIRYPTFDRGKMDPILKVATRKRFLLLQFYWRS